MPARRHRDEDVLEAEVDFFESMQAQPENVHADENDAQSTDEAMQIEKARAINESLTASVQQLVVPAAG